RENPLQLEEASEERHEDPDSIEKRRREAEARRAPANSPDDGDEHREIEPDARQRDRALRPVPEEDLAGKRQQIEQEEPVLRGEADDDALSRLWIAHERRHLIGVELVA